jgi:protein O-GlcNAc transferase
VLIGFSTPWEIKRNERLVKAAPNAFNRVVLIHSQPRSRFLALLEHCDVILDTWHFGGGNTTRDAFAVHSPVVTLPGEFLRGRTTAGLYTKMGLNHLISASPEAYADLAVALANDAALRHKVSKEISEARPALFDDDSVIPQYRDLFMGLAGR